MLRFFHPFVLPFCIGAILLFAICIFKYVRWVRNFDRLQKALLLKNILSWKFIPAIWETIVEALFHRRVIKHHFMLGYMHASIALGWFLLIVFGAIEASLAFKEGHPLWVPIFLRFFAKGEMVVHFKGYKFFTDLMDFLLCFVLSGILLAYIKRVYSRIVGMRRTTKHVVFDQFATWALWCIFPLRLIAECVTAAHYGNGGFLTQPMGDFIHTYFPLNKPYYEYVETTWWLLYSLALGVFFVALPFSRYMHIFTEPVLIYFRNLGLSENDKPSGFTKFELSACSRCGICIDNCPLYKDLKLPDVQSVYLLRDIRYKRVREEISNNCLMCDRCVNDCPVNLELTRVRRQTRYKEGLDTSNNYPYITNIQSFNAIGRVVYFAGCMSHLTPGIIESMKTIFEQVDQKYWLMDAERTICCGRPLIQQGFTNQAAELRRQNSKLIKQSGATLLITSCPICYQSFRKEYKLAIPIMHHTEYINALIKKGALSLTKQQLKVAYHDPCELGRGCGIYKQPRRVLQNVTQLVKTKNEKQKSLCCGYNLGNTVLEIDQQKKIRDAALENLLAKSPDLVATACPMCKKALTNGSAFPVKDIAEIICLSLKKS